MYRFDSKCMFVYLLIYIVCAFKIKIKIKLFNKNKIIKTAVPKNIPNRDLKSEVPTES